VSNDCKDILQTQNKTVWVRRSRTIKVSEQSIYQIQTAAELSESGKLRVNSSVFSWRLKDASEDNDVRDAGKLFHVCAAATGKARSPTVKRRVGGTSSGDVDDERRRRRAARADTRCKSRDKYDGARPFRQRKTSTESLNSIRCSILSPCSSWTSDVTCGRTNCARKQVDRQRKWQGDPDNLPTKLP